MEMRHLERVHGEGDWCWLRAYYFEDCKDDLILNAVWPAVLEIKAADRQVMAYFERDWIGGPNILLGFNRSYSDLVEPLTVGTRRIRDYIDKHPSRTEISSDEFKRRTQRLAILEARDPGDVASAIQPNNTVLTDCKEPFSPLLSPGALRQSVREFLCSSSSIVVGWLELVRAGTWQRSQIGLQAMIGLAWLANPENLRSAISFRSHANGFLRFMDSTRRLGEVFSQCYTEREGEAMRRLLTESVDSLQRGAHPLPGMDRYLQLLQSTLRDMYDGIRSGRYAALPVIQFAPPEQANPQAEINARLREIMKSDVTLQAWRITINLLYLMLNQLGLPASERYLACYLVSRAAEDVYGERVASISEELARSGDSSRVITFFDGHRADKGGHITANNNSGAGSN